jgi:hypothetical protein
VFGRKRVHVVAYYDFRRDTLAAYRLTCQFLGIDPGLVPETTTVNPNMSTRSRILRDLVQDPPQPLRRLLHRVSSKGFRRRAGSLLSRLKTRFEPRAAAPPAVTESLRTLIADEVSALKALLDLDVRSWLEEPAAGPSEPPP